MKMMKIIFSLLAFANVCFAATTKSVSKIQKSKRLVMNPVNVEVLNDFETNIDRLANPIHENVSTQTLRMDTKFKHKPMKKSVMINIPMINLQYAGQLDDKIRNINVQNTMIGVYLPKRGSVYSFSAITNYTDTITTNEDSRIEVNQYLNLTTDAGISQTLDKNHIFSIGPKFQVREYLKPSDDLLGEESDFIKYGLKSGYEFKTKEKISFGAGVSVDRKLFREKRALNANGSFGANLPEATELLRPGVYLKLPFSNGSIGFDAGYAFNEDKVEGGRTWEGVESSIDAMLGAKLLALKGKISRKQRNYQNQLVDNSIGNTIGEKYEVIVNSVSASAETTSALQKISGPL